MFTPFPPDLAQHRHHNRVRPTPPPPPQPPRTAIADTAAAKRASLRPSTSATHKADRRDGHHDGNEYLGPVSESDHPSTSSLNLTSQLSRVSGGSTETGSSSYSVASSSRSNSTQSSPSSKSKHRGIRLQARRLSLPTSPEEVSTSGDTSPSSPPPFKPPKGRGGIGSAATTKPHTMASSFSMALHGVKSRSRPSTPKDTNASGGSHLHAFGAREPPTDSQQQSSSRGTLGSGRSRKLRSASRNASSGVSSSNNAYSRQRATPLSSPHIDAGEASFGSTDLPSFDRRSSWESIVGRSASNLNRTAVWANLKPAYDDESAAGEEEATSSSSNLKRQPLPVRLGLVPAFPAESPEDPDQTTGPIAPPQKYRGSVGVAGARYVDGYYLHTAPPKLRARRHKNSSNQTVPTVVSDGSVHSQLSSLSSGTVSPRNEHDEYFHHHNGTSHLNRASSGRRPGPHILQPRSSKARSGSNPNHDDLDSTNRHARNARSSSDPHHVTSSDSERWELADYWNEEEYVNETGGKRRTRTHAYPCEEVPYFLSHDIDAITAEIDMHNMAYEVLSQRLSIFPFGEEKPAKVLDIGTGCGAWCVDLARSWPNTEIVGLDVAPCQTPVNHLRDPTIEGRLSWVVANFLEELPFPTASFDYVHVRFVGSVAVREDQWLDFLTEVARVLKPSGQLELIESNWTFIGNVHQMYASDLVKMTTGKAAQAKSHTQLVQPPKKFEAVQDAFDRMLGRRFINPKVTSVIPNALMNVDLRDIKTGVPRILPVLANASDQEALRALRTSSDPSATTVTCSVPSPTGATAAEPAQEDWAHRFVTRSQIGQPLQNSGFAPRDLPVVRALIIAGVTGRLWASRHLLWQEAEEEKMTLLAQSVGPQGNGRNRNSSACWAHPWRNYSDFIQEMSSHRKEMLHRAGIGNLLKNILGWREGNPESNEESRVAEKKRKMSVGIKNALGIDVELAQRDIEGLSENYEEQGVARSHSDPQLVKPSASSTTSSPASRRFANASESETALADDEDGDASEPSFLPVHQRDNSTSSTASTLDSPTLQGHPTYHHASSASLRTAFSTATTGTGTSMIGTAQTTPSSAATTAPSTPITEGTSKDETPTRLGYSHSRPRAQSQSIWHSHPSSQTLATLADEDCVNKDTFEMLGFAEFAGYLAKVPSRT